MAITIGIIGAGASGMAAAIEAARTNPDAAVTIYEKLPIVGKKLLVTGNGRCNILNRDPKPEMYYGDVSFAEQAIRACDVESHIHFFEQMGLHLYTEELGRLYPMSDQAASVQDAFRNELKRLGIRVIQEKITRVSRAENGFLLNDRYACDALIVAGGGKATPAQGSDGSCYPILRSLDVPVTTLSQALTGIKLSKPEARLKGVRASGRILIVSDERVLAESTGEIQYADYGISGIPVMEVSRCVAMHYAEQKRSKIFAVIDSLPDFKQEQTAAYLNFMIEHDPELTADFLLSGVMNKKLGIHKLSLCGIDMQTTLSALCANDVANLVEAIHAELCEISGTMGFDRSQVTAGGADLSRFDPLTMQSKDTPRLFVCGELLNVDGRCGGYNLTWAFTSGRLAGKAAALC